jgi:Zn-dependent protease with chaperone function
MRKSWVLVLFAVAGLGLWWWCNIVGYHYIYVSLHNWLFKHSQWQHVPETEDLRWYFWAAGLALTTAAIPFFGLGDWVVKLSVRMRKPTIVEQRIIEPALNIVLSAVNEKLKLNYTMNSFKIYVHEAPEINAFAFGRNSLCVFSGLLESTTEDELLAVLAHEVGHIWREDSRIAMVNYWVTALPNYLQFFSTAVGAAQKEVGKNDKKHYLDQHGKVITQNNMSSGSVLLLLLFFLIFPTMIAYLVSVIPLQLADITKNKFTEKRADLFSCFVGFSDGLYKFLENLSQYNYAQNKAIERFETHPSARERMGYVEEYRSGKLKMSVLFGDAAND